MKRLKIFLTIILTSSLVFSQDQNITKQLDFQEQLLYNTVRIVVVKQDNGKKISGTGTGFFFDFTENNAASRPYIITNKHVVENAVLGGFELILKDKNGHPDSLTKQLLIPNFVNQWIPHPDPNVDLCIMPIAGLINEALKKNLDFYYKAFRSINIPTDVEWNSLNVIENVFIIGYPIGLNDTVNHTPLIRSGTTSSPPFKDFNGKKEIVVDAGCFPGSSGSPVIYIPSPIKFSQKQKNLKDFLFLGVLYAGPVMKINGEIIVRQISTNIKPISESQIPINLGYVIKSDRINEFRKIIDK